jgi:hypothetical protein
MNDDVVETHVVVARISTLAKRSRNSPRYTPVSYDDDMNPHQDSNGDAFTRSASKRPRLSAPPVVYQDTGLASASPHSAKTTPGALKSPHQRTASTGSGSSRKKKRGTSTLDQIMDSGAIKHGSRENVRAYVKVFSKMLQRTKSETRKNQLLWALARSGDRALLLFMEIDFAPLPDVLRGIMDAAGDANMDEPKLVVVRPVLAYFDKLSKVLKSKHIATFKNAFVSSKMGKLLKKLDKRMQLGAPDAEPPADGGAGRDHPFSTMIEHELAAQLKPCIAAFIGYFERFKERGSEPASSSASSSASSAPASSALAQARAPSPAYFAVRHPPPPAPAASADPPALSEQAPFVVAARPSLSLRPDSPSPGAAWESGDGKLGTPTDQLTPRELTPRERQDQFALQKSEKKKKAESEKAEEERKKVGNEVVCARARWFHVQVGFCAATLALAAPPCLVAARTLPLPLCTHPPTHPPIHPRALVHARMRTRSAWCSRWSRSG